MSRKLAVFITIAILGLLLTGCPATVKPDLNDPSQPAAEIKVRIGDEYVTKSTFDSFPGNEPVNIVCEVTDPQGVHEIHLSFTGTAVTNCLVDGDPQPGGTLPLPAAKNTTLQGDSSGKVLTKLSIYENLGPFQCQHFQQFGRPVDHTVTVKCSGKNWSKDAQSSFAQTELAINIK